jgi:hypothetical protein
MKKITGKGSRARENLIIVKAHVLLQAFRKYLVSECWDILQGFSVLGIFNVLKNTLLTDDQVYNIRAMLKRVEYAYFDTKKNILKKEVANVFTLCFFYNVSNNEDWQLKLISDKQLIDSFLSLSDDFDENIWNIFISIAKHPGLSLFFLSLLSTN